MSYESTTRRAFLGLTLFLGLPMSALAQSTVEIVPNEAARRVDVLVAGKPFTSYIYPSNVKKPALYPIHTASGKSITRGFPPREGERADHPHHVGLWMNYGQVNGLDFWGNSDSTAVADRPKKGTIVHRAIRKAEGGAGKGTLEVSADWVDHQGKTLLREDVRYVFHAGENVRGIDRLTTWTALGEPVSFADTKEGMLGLRVTRSLEQPSNEPLVITEKDGSVTRVPARNEGVTGKYRSSEGVEGDAVWGTRAHWMTLGGTVEGSPVTIAILDHPKNVGFPTYWHARGYGLFAANPFGHKDFTNGKEELGFRLAAGESTTFRHRILILDGAATPEQIEQQYQAFAR